MVFESLRNLYPNHQFIGEESFGDNKSNLTDDPTWIIDPIDGTKNKNFSFSSFL